MTLRRILVVLLLVLTAYSCASSTTSPSSTNGGGSSGSGGSGASGTGAQLAIYTTQSTGWSSINVSVDGSFAGVLTAYRSAKPASCSTDASVVVYAAGPGSHFVSAQSNTSLTWSGSVTANQGCNTVELPAQSTSSGGSCSSQSMAGDWRRQTGSLFPACVNMTVRWNTASGTGTVVSSPSGCVFPVGDLKWKNLNANTCQMDDLNRSDTTGAAVEYDTYSVSVTGSTLVVGGVTYVR